MENSGRADGNFWMLSEADQETRTSAAQALHNLVYNNNDDRKVKREIRILRLLELIRDYCDKLRHDLSSLTHLEVDRCQPLLLQGNFFLLLFYNIDNAQQIFKQFKQMSDIFNWIMMLFSSVRSSNQCLNMDWLLFDWSWNVSSFFTDNMESHPCAVVTSLMKLSFDDDHRQAMSHLGQQSFL